MTGALTGAALAEAARALVGVPFRLHGRDPALGLDCIGVLEAACSARGLTVRLPGGYALRGRRLPPVAGIAARLGLREAAGPIEAGDVVMVRPGPCQHHLAIATAPDRFVHAHAGLRRVVEGPIPADWPVAGHWRADSSRT
ncbi:hypothetical protein SAMN05518801_101117 [Novosphingobium sp. CF614]|uniref:hypothetical protein n=1 Tax=Novosphingobium sp. CF614 TaxID=1884364 RepID=UPI0008F3B832|nr:hypothetical protein [Novosphingobium sp. CF614]SFF74006.1 hypothetical protein SAMN05518801_101117 [Novosphingobium sp. CF614]